MGQISSIGSDLLSHWSHTASQRSAEFPPPFVLLAVTLPASIDPAVVLPAAELWLIREFLFETSVVTQTCHRCFTKTSGRSGNFERVFRE